MRVVCKSAVISGFRYLAMNDLKNNERLKDKLFLCVKPIDECRG